MCLCVFQIAMMLQGQLKDKEDKEVKILVEEALKVFNIFN